MHFHDVSGRLKGIYVKTGDFVKKDDILAELIIDQQKNELEKQKITMDSRKKELAYLEKVSKIEIETAEDKLIELENQYQEMLNISGFYSENELRNIRRNLEEQIAILDKLKLSYANQISGKQNDIKLTELQLKELEENIEKCRIKSPMDGVVTYVAAYKEGEIIGPYTVIVSLADPTELQLEYNGHQASKFVSGMKVEVTIDNNLYEGEVVFTPLDAPADQAARFSQIVRIRVRDLPEGIKRGMQAEIKVVLDSEEDAVIIPRKAVKTYMGKDIVYVLSENVRVERYVKTGIQSTSVVQILEGVEPGDEIIID